jgi:predicted AlkP superfamily phosphohydrolase/phosphomutase
MKSSKLLLIGIDGATWKIIDPLIEKGKLPNFQKLKADGAAGPLESTVIPNTPPAWISFLTGKNPGKTGIYDFLRRQAGTYDMKVNTSLDNEEPTIFNILSKAGRTVCSINMPMTYPPERVNGTMVSGIPLPPGGRDFCHPAELISELEKQFGRYVVDIDYSRFEAQRENISGELESYDELLAELTEALRLRQKAILYLLEKNNPDLFSVVYSIVDRVQHYFWKFLDPSHPGSTEEGAARFGGAIDEAYEEVDRRIGELLKAAPDYQVVVMSDHGFGPYYRDFHLNRWLIEKGYLVLKNIPRVTVRSTDIGNILGRLGLSWLSNLVPRKIKNYPIPRPYIKRVADMDDIIWPETKAYSALMGISVNLKGREPQGIIGLGDEYKELTEQIMSDLKELRDERTDKPLIDVVDVKENRFHGAKVFEAADVYFMIAGFSYHITGRLDVDHKFDDRTHFGMSGTHRMDGIVMIRANGVIPGRELERASIMDIPSTILYIMGHPVLKGMDGRVLEEIFEDDFYSKHPMKFIDDEVMKPSRDESGYTKEEEEEILNLLKGLGYLS